MNNLDNLRDDDFLDLYDDFYMNENDIKAKKRIDVVTDILS